jgi:O-antigen ligase
MIFTQLGLFGMIPYILLMIIIFYDIYRNAKRSGNLYIRFAAYLYIANVLFSSIQSSYPCNNSMVMMTFIVTLMPYCVRWERDRIGMEAKPEVQHGY